MAGDDKELSGEEVAAWINEIADSIMPEKELTDLAHVFILTLVDSLLDKEDLNLSFEDKAKKAFGESYPKILTMVEQGFVAGFKSGAFNAYKFFEAQGYLEEMDTPDENIN